MGHMTHLNNMDEFGTVSHINPVNHISAEYMGGFTSGDLATWQKTDRLTRDFLGLTDGNGAGDIGHGSASVSVNVKDMLRFTGAVETFQQDYERDHPLLKSQGFGFSEPSPETWGDC